MNGQQLKNILILSLQRIQLGEVPLIEKKEYHRSLSKLWIESLTISLKEYYSKNKQSVVLSRETASHIDFGLNELLYDITVTEFDFTNSFKGRKLKFIKQPLLYVESEFARNSREAIKDFNKLVLGRAIDNLFIGPRTTNFETGYEKVFTKPAENVYGNIYLALIPHPSSWKRSYDVSKKISLVFFNKKVKRWDVF